ncbi:hypothetical protein GLYMA_15G219550v4 [Glycine max]|nr:hypothetical protein GLYMA_15G219550v4 [Glycine max]KAH1076549.1 hypothetical protein GYH30_052157 [Glycine max]KAH1099566.1 hypothetical protein GYH30_034962 [Glycine max]
MTTLLCTMGLSLSTWLLEVNLIELKQHVLSSRFLVKVLSS